MNQHLIGLDKALETISSEQIPTYEEEKLVAGFADMLASVSLKDPSCSKIASEVNRHHHTKSCGKYNSNQCRFGFPHFPTDETIITVPSKTSTIA